MFLLERLISSVAPHRCIKCGGEGSVLCAWCLPDSMPPLPSRCYNCRAITDNSRVCTKCRPTSRLGHVWVRTSYEDNAKRLIHNFKFERVQDSASVIAQLMAEPVPYLDRSTIVTHVPTATTRVRQRGYDHAKLIAKELAQGLGLPYRPLLIRIGQTRQVGAKRSLRLQQLRDSFEIVGSKSIHGAHILLVDDIITTGATLESAAVWLKKAGAKTVDAVVFAQKQ
jgi:ComF family protein